MMEAENIEEFRTQYQAFGLTLEGNAADWFQSLYMDEFHDLATFFEEFTQEFSKRGIKHNTFSLIYDFKQEAGESVKNAARRMKRYVKRCPREELPTEERRVSRFIEGLRSEMLKKDLYMRHVEL